MNDHVLVTGGTGKTGRRVAARLDDRGVPVRIASRVLRTPEQVRFDWLDETSFSDALHGVRAVYLVAPANAPEPLDAMRPFIDRALASGVERLVLLSSSMLEEGGPMMGAVHAYLHRHAPGWTVLRPSWFAQNFSEHQHVETIRREGRIYSATEVGRTPFVDAGDIAAVAVEALTNPAFADGEAILTGPAAISYDEAAEIIFRASGRAVAHVRLSADALAARFEAMGIVSAYADILAGMDAAIAAGAEDRVSDAVERITGRKPLSFEAFAAANAEAWR